MARQTRTPTKDKAGRRAKRTIKDSVFRDLFGNVRYLRELYLTLHPEDTDVLESDFTNVTIQNILLDQLYNDLGFTVRRRLLILAEAQSTWTVNILIRNLLYLAQTWSDCIKETRQNQYGSVRLVLPKPELYVIYTGERKLDRSWLSLEDEFFDGQSPFLNVRVKVLHQQTGNDVISQYIGFTRVYQEQRKRYGSTRRAVTETIRICKDNDLLAEYLASREKEVIDIMMTLFDQEFLNECYGEEILRRGRQEGMQQGIRKGMQQGIQQQARNTALKLFRRGIPVDDIAEIVNVEAGTVQSWLPSGKTKIGK